MSNRVTREQARADLVCMTPGPCDDCGESFRSYMVTDEVWAAAGLEEFGALVCLPCLAERLGRAVAPTDLMHCAANSWLTEPEPKIAKGEFNKSGVDGYWLGLHWIDGCPPLPEWLAMHGFDPRPDYPEPRITKGEGP